MGEPNLRIVSLQPLRLLLVRSLHACKAPLLVLLQDRAALMSLCRLPEWMCAQRPETVFSVSSTSGGKTGNVSDRRQRMVLVESGCRSDLRGEVLVCFLPVRTERGLQACADFVTSGSASAPATPAEPEEPVAESPVEEVPAEEQPVEEETPIDETTPIEDAPVEEEEGPVGESSAADVSAAETTTQAAPKPTTSMRPQPTSSTRTSSSSVVVPPVAETTAQATIPAVESPMPQQPDAE